MDPVSLITRRDSLRLLVAGATACVFRSKAYALSSWQAEIIVAAAYLKMGVRYELPPNWPQTTDCSRLSQWCYTQAGLSIPRTSIEQFKYCTTCADRGGLIFFWTDEAKPGLVTHVGINLGNGRMIDANGTRGRVGETSWLENNYWRRHFIASATI